MTDVTAPPDPEIPPIVPLLVLKSTVLFPQQVASVQIVRKANLRLLEQHIDPQDIVGAAICLDPDGPYLKRNLGRVAVACRILSRQRLADGSTRIVLQGLRRLRLGKIARARPYFKAHAKSMDEPTGDTHAVRDRIGELVHLLRGLATLDERYPDELIRMVELNAADGSRCADLVADAIQFSYDEKRRLLEKANAQERLGLVVKLLEREVERSQVAREVRTKTEIALDRSRRETFLREQLAVIRRELEGLDPAESEIAILSERVRKANLPKPVAEEVWRELQKLRATSSRAREGSAVRAYVDWVLALPWRERTRDRLALRRARKMLDARYFGLGSARDRLLEFLAVRKLGGHTDSPLLVILGPPGTGKTSLGSTVAEVLGRKCVQISMHGIHDEAEIHGQRRTEPAARPGRILDGLREAGARNPVIVIDHIERLVARDGSKALLALLQALDPTRHSRFRDHYLGVPFDLSEAVFVITANVVEDVPETLWPYLYAIELSGYTDDVKLAIAKESIWPEVVEEHGLEGYDVKVTSAALKRIIREYTREAGVRILKIHLQTVCRRVAVKIASRGRHRIAISGRNLEQFLGKPLYPARPALREPKIGAATGLAWTEAGGDVLPIEALIMPGEGFIMLTGLLGEVMEESVEAALSYVRSQADELDIAADALDEKDLHIHFPEGSIPKDGPSAGVAVATAIASLLSGRPVRPDVAMTGEISLQGTVLPVGGIREKVLAAYRAGIRRVILPKDNESDLAEIPRAVRGKMKISLVGNAREVFRVVLGKG